MDDFLKQQTLEHLNKAQNISIFVAKTADFDAFASGLALFLSLSKTNKNISINAKTPTVADAQTLYGVNNIGKSADKKNLIVSIDNAVKNVDKVTYFLDGDKLKVVIHAFPASGGVQEQDIQFERASVKPDLVIAIGYSGAEALKTELTHEQQISPDVFVISINKDKMVQEFAQINIHDQSNYAELVTNLIQTLSLTLDEDSAFNLYAALASATKMFSPNLVTPATFQIAEALISFGAGKASFAQPRVVTRPAPPPPPQSQPQPTPTTTTNFVDTFDVGQKPQDFPAPPPSNLMSDELQTSVEDVEQEKQNKDWLKPPKIYRGSKSFDSES